MAWSSLGGLLESPWTALGPQNALEGLWAAPRQISRHFSAILRANMPPKHSKRLRNRVQEATPAQNTISSKRTFCSIDLNYFQGPRASSWMSQSIKNGIRFHLRWRGCPVEASYMMLQRHVSHCRCFADANALQMQMQIKKQTQI